MTTTEDILAFLKAAQDARVKEKEEDKEIRAEERKEDMKVILDMIKQGVKKEVKTALQEVEVRVEQQEKLNQELVKKVNSLVNELENLKLGVKADQEAFPALPRPQGLIQRSKEQGSLFSVRSSSLEDQENEHGRKVEELCAVGRRVIGFSPIEPRMLELQIQSFGAKDQEEAMLMEVKSYMKCEMKVKPSEINKLDIVKIFPPAKDNWNVLYVEFGSEYQVDRLMAHTREMVKSDHRVVRWYPKQMYERYRAVESIAYDIRKTMKHKTRVKIGRSDIELSTRENGNTFWKRQALPDHLPKIDMNFSSRPALVSSPPPGRPGRAGACDEVTENDILSGGLTKKNATDAEKF